jgi:Helix-turn-helix domain
VSVITTDDRKILTPFDKRECISMEEAADIAGKSESTMRNWCEEHGLGRRVGGGTWMVSKVALAIFLDEDLKALKAYHAGDRTHPAVIAYFQRAGLEILVDISI